MELKDFIGKVVVSNYTKRKFKISNITAPTIEAYCIDPNERGCYSWPTISGDPFTNGDLAFEDETLLEPFKAAYNAYCRTEDAYWEEYGYWMMRE